MLSNTDNWQRSWYRHPAWAAGSLLFLVYVTTAIGTTLFVQYVDPSLRVMSVAVPWLAVGVGVAGILLGGPRLWPALFIGSWVVWGIFLGHSVVSVTVDAVAEAGSIVLIVRLLSIWGFARDFDRFRDPIILLVAATIGRVLATSLDWVGAFGAAYLTPEAVAAIYRPMLTGADGAFPVLTPEVLRASIGWTLNSIAGIVLVVPLVSAKRNRLHEAFVRRPISFLGFGVSLTTWTAAALSLPMAAAPPLLMAALMLVAWASIRLGTPVAAFVTLIMSLVATVGVDLQMGPLASDSPLENIGLQWGFITLLALTGLMLTALLAERRRDLERLTDVAARYKRFFKSNPSPLWVAEPNGGRILMVNDTAIRRYGYNETEFLAMTAAELAADPVASQTPASGDSTPATRARALRHRTRGGAAIDIEFQSTPIELDGRPAELCYAVDVTDRVELRSRLLAAADLERRHFAQELHDGLGQLLTGLNLGAHGAIQNAARGTAVDAALVDFLIDASNDAVKVCRDLTRGVSPLEDAGGDLLEALRRLSDSLPPGFSPRLEIVVDSQAPLTLSLERSEHLYRVVQEAVNNALKHAKATYIRVLITVTQEAVRVSIEDDGIGILDAIRPTSSLGMRSMELRATAVGAIVEVSARAAGGTLVHCECPQQAQFETHQRTGAEANHAAREPPITAVQHNIPSSLTPQGARSDVARCLLLAVLCFAGMTATQLLATIIDPRVAMYSSQLAIPSLLCGFSTAGLILGGARLWPGIAGGAMVGAALLLSLPWRYAIYYGAEMAVVALIIQALLMRWGFRRSFDHWQDPVLLFAAAIVGASASSTLSFLGLLAYQSLRPGELNAPLVAMMTNAAGATPVVTGALLSALGRWWADGVAGTVIIVPLLVAIPPISQTLRGHRAEVAIWCVALLGWAICMLSLNEVGAAWPLLTMALALLVWAVMRFGVAMASAAISVCALVATLSYALQHGVLISSATGDGIGTLWWFLLLLTVTGMFLTALLSERNRTLAELFSMARRYRGLFEHDPHPLWVEDFASGQILMVNEQAIRHYGYSKSEWLRLTAERLTAYPIAHQNARSEPGSRPAMTRHRLKSGAVIDVELTYAAVDMDGRSAMLCFSVDATERNALRRAFLEATDLERRRLAGELHKGLGSALAELKRAAKECKVITGTGQIDPAAIERFLQASRRASGLCRQTAHNGAAGDSRSVELIQQLF
ncbi:MAG: PAS domain S-box protein [Steroidobacteraceae bacterium]|jgi:PAS domain S-box-containing protein